MAEEITLDNFNATFDDDESEIESSNSSTTMNTSSLHDGGKKKKKLLLVGLVSGMGLIAIAIGLGISFSPSKTGKVSNSLETDTSSTSATLSLEECLALDEYSWYNSSTWVPTWSPTSPSSEDEDTYDKAAAESDFLPVNYDLISTDDEDDKVDILPLDIDTDDRLQNMIASNGGEDIRKRRRELRMRKSMMTDLAKVRSTTDNGETHKTTARKRHLEECTIIIELWIEEMCSSETSEYVSNDESESESSSSPTPTPSPQSSSGKRLRRLSSKPRSLSLSLSLSSEEEYVTILAKSKCAKSKGSKSSQPATTRSDMTKLNAALATYSYDNVTNIKREFEALGYSLIATPTFGALAEDMEGAMNITELGKFSLDEFGCKDNPILPSTGFGNSLLNGHPYMLFAGFDNNGFRGSATQLYRDYKGEDTDLLDLFYPNEERGLYAFVLNEDGSTVEVDSNTTSTIFSDNQQPKANGYYLSDKFSSDDGVWGFRIGSNVNGDGGPYLEDDPANSYGVENANSGDRSRLFYWGEEVRTSQYAFYFAIKRVGNICAEVQLPSAVPSTSVSPTYKPTTPPPSSVPSISTSPSISSMPSCSPNITEVFSFTPLALTESDISGQQDDDEIPFTMPFPFPWGNGAVTDFGVTTNGAINVPFANDDDGCCDAEPITPGGSGYETIPRISVAQEDLDPEVGGGIYIKVSNSSVTFSWEDVPFISNRGVVNAQATLYDNGDITFCYGSGTTLGISSMAAGLEDDTAGFAYPITNDIIPGFNEEGITGTFPSNQCACFIYDCKEIVTCGAPAVIESVTTPVSIVEEDGRDPDDAKDKVKDKEDKEDEPE